jgi:hypothetical protein
MGLPYAKARITPTGATTTHYRNLEQCSAIRAAKVVTADSTTLPAVGQTTLWFAQGTGPDGDDFYFLSNAGYATQAACNTAIETALGSPL